MICAWALFTAAREVGTRCDPGGDPAAQDDIAWAADQIDRYVMANAEGMTSAKAAAFKREQAQVGAPAEVLCRNEAAISLYQGLRQSVVRQGSASFRAQIAKSVEKPGTPTWGTCL